LESISFGTGIEWNDISEDAFNRCDKLRSITFVGKTKDYVRDMAYYPWSLPSGCIIHCSDGDIQL
jgi:hypothetical protein